MKENRLMFAPWRVLRSAVACLRPRRPVLLGRPYRATIAAAACGGYLLLIHYAQGTEWVDLPIRMEEYDRPDEREFTAAEAALADRRLAWVLPWQLDQHGNLTAPVTTTTRSEGVSR